VIFKQENVEVPKSWSVLATKVVVSKYFYGEQHTFRARNLRAPAHTPHHAHDCGLGHRGRLFSKADGEIFYEELTWLCVNQYGAFNSPVWFNVGLYHEYGVGKNSSKRQLVLQPQDQGSRTRQDAIRISAGQCMLHPVRQRRHGNPSCTWLTARRCCSNTVLAPAPI